jgi:hypothetical protein
MLQPSISPSHEAKFSACQLWMHSETTITKYIYLHLGAYTPEAKNSNVKKFKGKRNVFICAFFKDQANAFFGNIRTRLSFLKTESDTVEFQQS